MKGLERYLREMESLPQGILEAEVQAERTEIASLEVMGGEQKGIQCSDVTELFIRATVDTREGKRTGLYYTQNLEEDPKEALGQAAKNAVFSSADETVTEKNADSAHLTARDSSDAGGLSMELLKKNAGLEETEKREEGSWEERKALAFALERELKKENPDSQILIRLIQTKETRGIARAMRRDGAREKVWPLEAETIRYEAEMEIAEEERGRPYFYACSKSAGTQSGIEAAWFLEQIRKWRGMRLERGHLEAGEYPAVLDCEVAANLFATAWQMFTGKNYLTGATPYAGKMEMPVMSQAVTIKNLPFMEGCGYRYVFDCEGYPVRPLTIVSHGMLKGLLHTASTAGAMGVEPTGTAGRKALLSGNIPTDRIPVPANFCMEKGEKSTKDLLRDMGDGVYVFESFDVFHSINIASGEFHVPCKGILVKGGEAKAVVEGITINGTIQELLKDTEEVGSEVWVRPMDLLKSYTVSTPGMRIKKLKFTGSQS